MNKMRAWAERDGRGYPDWAMRYVPIVRRLRGHGLDSKRVLEIGANANGLARFASLRLVAFDLARTHLDEARVAPGVVPCQGDIAALPFPDGAFDIVACIDTFEHLPDSLRANAAREILRVLAPRGVAVVSFPSGNAARKAEEYIRSEYFHYTGQKLRWLEEHAAGGLPDAAAMTSLFAKHPGASRRVTREANANIRVWIWTWRVLMGGWPGRGNALAQVLLRILTPLLARAHFGACYRTIIWIEPAP
jgi:SAM-dependent methyltransferase